MASTSIIVPVFNAEKYLREAVDSILKQTLGDWQLILVDDGSTDASSEICDLYAAKDGRIEVVHVPNGGLSYARNRGMERAKGEWVAFLDADDCLHSEFLERLLGVAETEGCDIVAARNGESETLNFDGGRGKLLVLNPERAIETVLYQNSGLTNSVCGKLFRRRLFDGLPFSEGLYYEDLDIFYRLFERAGAVAYVDAVYYFYRQHAESIVHSWQPRRLDVLTVVDKLEAYMAVHHCALLPAARDRKLSANFNIFNLAVSNGESAVADKCWQVIRRYRRDDLFNPDVRLKNRLGILASYLGRRIYCKLFL